MRVLVLGGTGHLGCAITREAVARGFAVSVVSRNPGVPRNLEGVPIDMIRADVGDRQRMRDSFGRVDLVIDAAAPYPLHPERGVVERAIARMRALVRDVADSGARFAYVGSFVTLPHSHDALSRAIRAAHPYFAVKAAMEAVVLDACTRGLRAVLVNPTACLGPWDPKPAELAIVPMLMRGLVPIMVSAPVNVVDVRDVAEGILAAVEGERYGERIGLGGHELHTDELARRICAIAEVPAPRVRMPEFVALAGAAWGEAAFAAIGRRSPIPALGMLLLHESRDVRPAAAAPRDLDDTLRDAVQWWRERA